MQVVEKLDARMVGVRLEGELMVKIREMAKREHRTLAGMVRVFIIESIERRERNAQT